MRFQLRESSNASPAASISVGAVSVVLTRVRTRPPLAKPGPVSATETETGRAVRTARWKYGVTAPYDADEPSSRTYAEAFLYDLDNDPYELVNLIGMPAFRGVAADLRGRLLEWIARIEGESPSVTAHAETGQRQHWLNARNSWQIIERARSVRGHGGA